MSTAGRTRARRGLLAGLVGCAVFAVAVGPSTPAGAASDTVTTCAGSGPGSLPAVVAAAASGATVTFSVSCPPDTPIVLGSTLAFPADMTIDGPGPDEMAISGGGSVGVLSDQGRTVTLSGVTIEDGVGESGAGIDNNGALTLTNSVVVDNSAEACAGIDNDYYLTLTDTTVADNIGGGVCSDQTHLTVSGSFILDNEGMGIDENSTIVSISQSTISGNTGGGLSNTFGSVGLYESTISDNSGDDGGGIANAGQMTVTDSTVTGNSSSSGGGGGIDNGSQLTITDSTVSDNTAASGDGGGIITAGELTVNDSTVAANSAPQGQGGGIWNDSGTFIVALTASTVADNSAPTGGNIYNTIGVGGRVSGTVSATGTIVADSPAGGNCAGAPVTDDGYNVDNDGSCNFTLATDVDAEPAGLDPSGLQSNGGPTETIALQPGSPAFGLVTPAALCQNPDQRGVARPTPCAAGAFQTTVDTVTTCAATGPGSLPAVVAAAANGDTVDFVLSPPCSTIILSGPLDLGSEIRIDGPGAGVLAVSGHGAVEVIDVSAAATVTVAGLTIEDGDGGDGGGILNGGTLTVLDSTVTNNTGGGIVNLSTALVSVLDSTVEKNSGSGLANEGGLAW